MCDYKIQGRPIIVEKTGFKDNDQVPPWCARVYLPGPWWHDVAYGQTRNEAVAARMQRVSVQAYIASVSNSATEGKAGA